MPKTTATPSRIYRDQAAIDAFACLKQMGVHFCVPGIFDITTTEQLLDYINDKELFYKKQEGGAYGQ